VLKQINGKWVLVSKKTQRHLAYYRGEGKPSEEWVRKQEARIQAFKQMNEASYAGNIGIHELIKFHTKATQDQKKQLDSHIKNKDHEKFKALIKDVTGIKLHDVVESYLGVGKALSPILHPHHYKKAAEQLRQVLDKKKDSKRHDPLYYASVIAQQHPHVDAKKLIKMVKEAQEFESKAGAGEEGTDRARENYQNSTPGQKIKKFNEYKK
jgi:hypothetical protein